jgi:hypothetical protein
VSAPEPRSTLSAALVVAVSPASASDKARNTGHVRAETANVTGAFVPICSGKSPNRTMAVIEPFGGFVPQDPSLRSRTERWVVGDH